MKTQSTRASKKIFIAIMVTLPAVAMVVLNSHFDELFKAVVSGAVIGFETVALIYFVKQSRRR
jgi:hypothetical protein